MSYQHREDSFYSEYSAEQGKFLTPFQRRLLLKDLQSELRPEYRRRIEIILLANIGKSQTQICAMLGCSQETARYWIAITHSGQAHLWKQSPVGRPKTVNDQYLDRLKELVSHSPRDYGYPFQNWTAQWLSKHLAKELGIEISDRHVNRLLKNMGLSSQHHRAVSQPLSSNSKNSKIVIGNLQALSPEGSRTETSNIEGSRTEVSTTKASQPEGSNLWTLKPQSRCP